LFDPIRFDSKFPQSFPSIITHYREQGTAIQNNYTEFWTILNWSNPGRLGTLAQWNNWVTKPLIRARDTKATPEQVATGKVSLWFERSCLNLSLPQYRLLLNVWCTNFYQTSSKEGEWAERPVIPAIRDNLFLFLQNEGYYCDPVAQEG